MSESTEKYQPSTLGKSIEEERHRLYPLVRFGLHLRYINLIAVACTFIGALCMCFVGLIKTIRAVFVFLSADYSPGTIADPVTGYVVQAMDAFVFAMVLVVFSTSIFHLFIFELDAKDFKGLRGFRRANSINELKKILSQLIIVLLFVHFLKLTIEGNSLEWEFLIIPAGALLMAIALKLLNFGGSSPASKENQEESSN